MQGLIGIIVLLILAWAFSERRKGVKVREILVGLGIQALLAFFLLRVEIVREALLGLNYVVRAIEYATTEGTKVVFGFLGGDTVPFELTADAAPYIFAFRVLPQILVFSVVISLLWYWKILPPIIRMFAAILRRSLGVGGAVGVSASASVFLGMVEAPMVIRAYLKNLTRSELFVVMTCGMSTVAGSIMVLYANLLGSTIDGALGHVLIASVVNVIGAVYVARIMVPEDSATEAGDLVDSLKYESVMDAISRGGSDGLKLVANVAVMVIILVSLVALCNFVLGLIPLEMPITLQRMMGWLFAPIAWLMGISWADANAAGSLLGTKLILNELIAFIQLSEMGSSLTAHTRLIMTYALCGFTNFGSLGILIGGVSALAPDRRADLLSLGPKTLVSGTIVACLTGTIVGLISW